MVIMYSRQSFQNVNRWVEDVRKERNNDAVIVLIGNKKDLEEER